MKLRTKWLSSVCAACVLAMLAGCSSGTTTSGSSGSTGGGDAGGGGGGQSQATTCGSVAASSIPGVSSACEACYTSSCCEQGDVCDGNPDCVDLIACIANCSTDACSQACANQYPNGLKPAQDFLNCTGNSCSSC